MKTRRKTGALPPSQTLLQATDSNTFHRIFNSNNNGISWTDQRVQPREESDEADERIHSVRGVEEKPQRTPK
ncbi:hypothetical protein NDU88_001799 [Pleurodeles waltl]|uniref:Uncharacterized protein n=1 Tax=Pleurodeles waltl TaxID=8319 RepID=A0AAV7SAQ5_PLEWA|nr:hypothetical protein NDU88_001799 [Pleurodeles waltl]